MKQSLLALVRAAVATLPGGLSAAGTVQLQRTRDARLGDFTTSAAMRLAGTAAMKPGDLAQAILEALPANTLLARTEIAGPGFINFFLSPGAYAQELARVHREADRYGTRTPGSGERVQVRLVSRHADSPLQADQGRQAAFAAALANVLAAAGDEVAREGFPSCRAAASCDQEPCTDTLIRQAGGRPGEGRGGLAEPGPPSERWFSGDAPADGALERALARLSSQGRLHAKNGAVWLRASGGRDHLVMGGNDMTPCLAAELADHLERRERGFIRLIDVRGADHASDVARLRALLTTAGEPGDCFEVNLIQPVRLLRGTTAIPAAAREGRPITLRQLQEEIGRDACRFFCLMRSPEEPLELDLDQAASRNLGNPLYCVQYAHARVVSVMNEITARGLSVDKEAGLRGTALLTGTYESRVLHVLTGYPEVLAQAATRRAPHLLVHHLCELASTLHAYHQEARWVVPETALRHARLTLVLGVQQVIRNGLTLLGVSAPESM